MPPLRGLMVSARDLIPRRLGALAGLALGLSVGVAPVTAAPADDPSTAPGGPPVWIEGRRLMVAGQGAFVMRGVLWSPVGRDTATTPTAADNVTVRRAEFGRWQARDIPNLVALGVNTVRLVIDPGTGPADGAAGLRLMDALHEAGIRVVMNADAGVNDLERIAAVVPHYRDHPALLLWMLGSEWNQNLYFGLSPTPADAAQRTERAAALVKRLDPNHPVAASLGDIHLEADGRRLADTSIYVNQVCVSVDLWGLNVYRGRSFGTLFEQWAALSNKPMFLGEFGADAFATAAGAQDLSSNPPGRLDVATQADWNLALWGEIRSHLSADQGTPGSASNPKAVAVGGTLFEWNDEWWKVPPPGVHDTGGLAAPGQQPDDVANEEWFGLVDVDRRPRPAFDALRDAFAEDARARASRRAPTNP